MNNPFRRNAAAHRPALRPAPGMPAYELETDGFELGDDEDSDWATWEDAAPEIELEATPPRDR